MDAKKFFAAMGDVDARYIEKYYEERKEAKKKIHTGWRLSAVLVAAIMALLLMGAGVVTIIYYGDLWVQSPSDDPVQSVRSVLENQMYKDYAIKVEIKSVEIDPAETIRVRENFISGEIARRQGWSSEYLEDHFVVVKAVYYAQYDADRTNRSDGDVIQYFYLTQDENSGEWTIVDNSGNINWEEGKSDPVVPPETASVKEQIFTYLSELFNQAYTPYYDGLHYEISSYEEDIEQGEVTATFLWTMYHLGNRWDVSSDEGREQQGNLLVQVRAQLQENGSLDQSTISVLANQNSWGPPVYDVPIQDFFPKQLSP